MHQRTELSLTTGLTQRHFYKLTPATTEARQHIADMQTLSESGILPSIRRIKRNIGGCAYDLTLHQRIEGFDLSNLPDTMHEEIRSNKFAKSLAQAFLLLEEAGYAQHDPQGGNFMYEVRTGKVWNIDDEVIEPRRPEDTLKKDVFTYVQILHLTFFGIFSDDSAFRILLNPHADSLQKQEVQAILLQKYQEYGIDPELVSFILDTLDEKTRPENFDRILALK